MVVEGYITLVVRYSGVCNSVACHLQSLSALAGSWLSFTQVCFDIPALSHTAWLLQKTLSSGPIMEEQCGCVVCCQLLVVEHITSTFLFLHSSALSQSVGLLKETLVVGPLKAGIRLLQSSARPSPLLFHLFCPTPVFTCVVPRCFTGHNYSSFLVSVFTCKM